MRTKAIVLNTYGDPDELRLADVDVPDPRGNELFVRHTAVGVNFHDCYVRSGLYKTLALPGIPGIEGVGIVEKVGPQAPGFEPGDRIGWISGAYGGYAAARLLSSDLAFKVPASLTDAQAAASLMKMFTTCMLVRKVHAVGPGQTVLVHAAAGGVGQLLSNWCHHLGAEVIGTVGSVEKAEIARRCGADHVILYRQEDFVARVLDITGGKGVAAAYDAIGKDTFSGSMRCLDYEGRLVNYGQTSGPVEPFSPSDLAGRSLSVARPIIFHYLRTRERLEAMAREVFAAVDAGAMKPIEPIQLGLGEAAEAHRLLEAQKSPGGVVLIP